MLNSSKHRQLHRKMSGQLEAAQISAAKFFPTFFRRYSMFSLSVFYNLYVIFVFLLFFNRIFDTHTNFPFVFSRRVCSLEVGGLLFDCEMTWLVAFRNRCFRLNKRSKWMAQCTSNSTNIWLRELLRDGPGDQPPWEKIMSHVTYSREYCDNCRTSAEDYS